MSKKLPFRVTEIPYMDKNKNKREMHTVDLIEAVLNYRAMTQSGPEQLGFEDIAKRIEIRKVINAFIKKYDVASAETKKKMTHIEFESGEAKNLSELAKKSKWSMDDFDLYDFLQDCKKLDD